MPEPQAKLRDRIRELQRQSEDEWAARRSDLRYRLEAGRVVFEDEVRKRHRQARVHLGRSHASVGMSHCQGPLV